MKRSGAARALVQLAVVLGLAGCGSAIPQRPQLNKQPDVRANVSPQRNFRDHSSSTSPDSAARPSGLVCTRELLARGVKFQILSGIPKASGSYQNGYVQLELLKGDRNYIAVRTSAPFPCETAKALNDWARFGVDRAARQILGQSVTGIDIRGDVPCRSNTGENRLASQADCTAVEVSGIVLADGRGVIIKRDWQGGDPATREFLRVIFKSACKRFPIVLGPALDTAYHDHFHLGQGSDRSCR